ncbi:MAG TPA: flagellar assembly protein H [Cyanobacteria bacterium UBA12227]|nr:flagellar assembly protein H [Cyanobacteria bacterium UBA12227]HAX88797.1 flagellar assembly protein H [Cyanobacteria bacterium UBA11370]
MTRFPHDQFAKEYFEELLCPLGGLETSLDVPGEMRQIDVYFTPTSTATSYAKQLGLLGQLATTPAIFEPFRNAVTPSQIRSCIAKLFDLHANIERSAKRENRKVSESQLPWLWILTPTASSALLDGFGFRPMSNSPELTGVYVQASYQKTGLVAIHQLLQTPQTLWLRILGKGRVQTLAIEELAALPGENQLRDNTLELLYELQAHLNANQIVETEDRELIMALAPLYRQQINAAIQQGIEQGVQQGQRRILESFLQERFGELSEQMLAVVESLSVLPTQTLTRLLLQLSQLETDELALQQAQRLMVETLLKFRLGELDEQLTQRVDSLLALSPQELKEVLQRSPELSREQLLALLADLFG